MKIKANKKFYHNELLYQKDCCYEVTENTGSYLIGQGIATPVIIVKQTSK